MFFSEFLIVKENRINTAFLLFNDKLFFAYQSFTITSLKFTFVFTSQQFSPSKKRIKILCYESANIFAFISNSS